MCIIYIDIYIYMSTTQYAYIIYMYIHTCKALRSSELACSFAQPVYRIVALPIELHSCNRMYIELHPCNRMPLYIELCHCL